MRKVMVSFMLFAFLLSSVALAEKGEGRKRRGERGAKKGARGPKDPLANIKLLSKRLKLDQGQESQIQPICEQYAQARQALIEAAPQESKDKYRDLMQQMRQARKGGDKEKMRELIGQLRELRQNDPQAQQLVQLRAETATKIEPLLRDDQKELLGKMARSGQVKGAAGNLNNPRFLRMCVGKLDLRPEQKSELKKIDTEFKEAFKAAPKDKRAEMGKQYADEIMKLLDEPQKQQLEEIAKQGPGRGGIGALANPKRMDAALAKVDLRPEQKTNIDALMERYKSDLQAAGKDRRARAGVAKQFVTDVLAQLDEQQKAKLMEGRRGKAKSGQGGRGGSKGGRPATPGNL